MHPESFGTKVTRTMKKIFRYTVLLIILVGLSLFAFYYWGKFDDDGVKSGVVISLSHKGVIFKTWEGTINIHTFGARKGVSPIVESFDFSVEGDNEALIKELKEVALRGELVNLHFIERYAAFPWRGETKYFATSVERLPQ